jgi:hypothetical protein
MAAPSSALRPETEFLLLKERVEFLERVILQRLANLEVQTFGPQEATRINERYAYEDAKQRAKTQWNLLGTSLMTLDSRGFVVPFEFTFPSFEEWSANF